jgi:hypothetical protein
VFVHYFLCWRRHYGDPFQTLGVVTTSGALAVAIPIALVGLSFFSFFYCVYP